MKKILAAAATWWKSPKECDLILEKYRAEGTQANPQGSLSSTWSSHRNVLTYDAIKSALENLGDTYSGRIGALDIAQWQSVSKENLPEVLRGANDMEINVGFLWAAFLGRSDLFEGFLTLGAQLSFSEPTFGLTPLHLAAYSDCASGTEYLVSQRGCYVNSTSNSCYTPLHWATFGNSARAASVLLDKGAHVDVVTSDLEGILHCAVTADAVECVRLFCDKEAPVNQPDSSGKTPTHLAAELGRVHCLEALLEIKRTKVNQQTNPKKQTALHLAAKNRHCKCVDLLLSHGAAPNITDYRYRTPLHLAAKSGCKKSVEKLLKRGKADPNAFDSDLKTALHLAVQAEASCGNPCEVVKTLIRYGAAVNAKDNQNCTALHLAAQHELTECVEALILSDADVTSKSNSGTTALATICRKTPAAVNAIRKTLDQSITFTHQDKECGELRIDFNVILPKEIGFLMTLVEEGQTELLLHPLCRSFLCLKWQKIRRFFIFRAFWCFALVAVMSSYVLLALGKHCYNFSRNVTFATHEMDENLCLNYSFIGYFLMQYPYVMEIEWYFMVIIAFGTALRKLCVIPGYVSFSHYVCTMENILDWCTIATVFLISFVYTGRTYVWQNHVCAFGIMMGWINLMYILANFPFFGTYIAMYFSVQREFAKLLLVFSCLLIGFTVSFCVLFPRSVPFSNIFIGFIAVLVMAVGDTNFDLISRPSKEDAAVMLEGTVQIFYVAYIICVSIILLNLLVGIVVNDIQALRSNAKLTKLVKVTKMIYFIEESLRTDHFHRTVLVEWLQWGIQLSSNVVTVKLRDQRHGDLPKDILRAAHEVARSHKRKNKSIKMSRNTTNYNAKLSLGCLKDDLENLKNEIVNVKSVLKDNQRLMGQILGAIDSKITHSENFSSQR